MPNIFGGTLRKFFAFMVIVISFLVLSCSQNPSGLFEPSGKTPESITINSLANTE